MKLVPTASRRCRMPTFCQGMGAVELYVEIAAIASRGWNECKDSALMALYDMH